MNKPDGFFLSRAVSVPESRVNRLLRTGGLLVGVAGNVALAKGRDVVAGNRRPARDLFLTPANATRLTEGLAQMRGAAMKVGQMISMETGEFLSPELSSILSHLQANAHFMPPRQLKSVLVEAWGADFLSKFHRFDVRPIAAASIGQVHRAQTKDGRDLAIKVQYPGIRRSIDSDVRNVASLLSLSGLAPDGLDLRPLLEEVRTQLHEEADYEKEGANLTSFANHLSDSTDFLVPVLHKDLTTHDILAMDYVQGTSVDELSDAKQQIRDRFVDLLIRLLFRELFELGTMQTDPNFANYLYSSETGRVVLLDFGATRRISPRMSGQYRRLLAAGLSDDAKLIRETMIEIGYFEPNTSEASEALILKLFRLAMAPLRNGGVYDFGSDPLATDLREAGLDLIDDRHYLPVPPANSLYLQRKIGGMYLLATRLRARVDMDSILTPYYRRVHDHPPC